MMKKQRQAILVTQGGILNVFEDELNIGKSYVDLEFFLPSGSYATVLLKRIDAILGNCII